jgi:hypothetical protein
MFLVSSLGTESSADFSLTLAHTDGDLNEGVGNSFVVSELHQLWSHGDSELFGHIGDLIEVWLGGEGRGESMERSLSVHETLQLGCGIVTILHLKFFLLLFSLGISFLNGLVELSLHESSLLSGTFDGIIVILELDEVVILWESVSECLSKFVLELVSNVFAFHVGLRQLQINCFRLDWHDWFASWEDNSWVSITSMDMNSLGGGQ